MTTRPRIFTAISIAACIAAIGFASPAEAGRKPAPTPTPTPTPTATAPVRSGTVIMTVSRNQLCGVDVKNDTYDDVVVSKNSTPVKTLPSGQLTRVTADVDFATGEVVTTTVSAAEQSLTVTAGCTAA